MAYQKHNWVNKEIIKADQLNHIEDGIYQEEQRAKVAEEALDSRIDEIVIDSGAYKVVLDHTQVVSPSPKYIYLEPDAQATGADKFKEWVYVYNESLETYEWKMIGDVSLDLSDYVQNTDYASDSAFGIVKVDGSTITASNGVISAAAQATGVTSFNGRTGDVSPQSGDYTASDVGLGNVGNFKAVSTNANQGLSTLEQASARANIGAGTSDFDGAYSSLTGTPTLGTASALDVASSGDAGTSEVVKGNDSRLTDARTPVSHTHTTSQITDFPSLGSASSLNVALSGDASSSEVVKGDDSRLSDARTPVSHTHTTSDVTDFPTLANVATSGSYNDLSNKPSIPTATSDLTNDSGFITSANVPTKTSDLTNDSGFIDYKAVSTVANQGLSDTEKANARTNIGAGSSTFSGDYNDLTNKPTLGTAAAKDVPTSGNASTSQVVMGNDSRLSDSRTPTSHNQASNTINAMTGYSKASSAAAIATTDSLNTAIGKLEKTLDGKGTSNLTIGTTSTTAAAGNHTHTLTIATDSGTNQITLAANTKYKITAGGSTYIFTTPPDNNTRDFKKGTSRSGATADVLYFVYTT